MKIKSKAVLILISLIFLLGISAASAENITDEGISFDDEINTDDNILTENENSEIITATNTIYISPDGTGSGSNQNDPTNWDLAISKANSGDIIQFSNGTFKNIKGNIYASIELKGSGNTTLDAEQNDGFFQTYAGSTVKLTNLSFINAYTGDKQGNPDGPKTGFNGEGAIVNNGVLIVTGCYFASNQGIGTEGGAIHNSGTCYIYDSEFFRNSAKKGGAIYSDKNSRLYVYNTIFNKGAAKEGTAFSAKDAYAEFINCSIVNSSAKCGLISVKKSTVKIIDSYFYNSKAVDTAAVINVEKESTVEVDNCIFEKLTAAGTKLWFHNETGDGNGGAIVVEKGATISIKNSLFDTCTAKNDGGAILVQSSGSALIDNCTFKSNKANYGSNIYSYGSVSLTNSIIEIESAIETHDIAENEKETVKITVDNGINFKTTVVNVLIDGVKSQYSLSSSSTLTLEDLSAGTHTVSLEADDLQNRFIFSQESSTFNVGNTSNSSSDVNSSDLNNTGSNSTVKDNESETNNSGIVKNTRLNTFIDAVYTFERQANDWGAGERGDYFYAVLKDENGKPLANMTCLIAVNGPIYPAVTNEKGEFGIPVNLAAANTYTYALTFLGNDDYKASFNSTKLVLKAKKTTITAASKTFKKAAKTKTVSVTLKTVKNPFDGKTYLNKGKKITLTVNGKKYTAKTNAKGVAKFNIKLNKKGKYTAKISFAGDKTYSASKKSVKITIK